MTVAVKRGFSLVELLVVVVLLALLAAFLFPRYAGRGNGRGGAGPATPMQRARTVECINNLQQLRAAYQVATTSGDENAPRELAELKQNGATDSMMKCPDSKQPYQFDSASGKIRCLTPGHERY